MKILFKKETASRLVSIVAILLITIPALVFLFTLPNHGFSTAGVYSTLDHGGVTYTGGEACMINMDLESQTPEGTLNAAKFCNKHFKEDIERGYLLRPWDNPAVPISKIVRYFTGKKTVRELLDAEPISTLENH